jgi:tetratricopeptide (TPR) repeat protein
MQTYSVRDVERVLRLSRSTIRGLIETGFVKPTRGPRREYRFSFQDLIVLRAARALLDSNVSRRRIRSSLEELRKHLPDTVPLSGLSICAVGDRVVVREGKSRWQVDNKQYLLGLDVSMEDGVLRVVERPQPEGPRRQPKREDTVHWFEKALELESTDLTAAAHAYEKAVELDPDNVAAWINWGRVLHERGTLKEAEAVYRRAVEHGGNDPLLMFNLGVLLEDLGRADAAVEAYQSALAEDPTLADCHYNLARLYESLGKPQHAIRHLGQYRRLMSETR